MLDSKLSIAEVFTSIHGEGRYAGTRMTFFRLAGCSVGRYVQPAHPSGSIVMPILPTGNIAWECTTFDGRKFPCDTDFNKTEELNVIELMSHIPRDVSHVCITGGEPLIHLKNSTFLPLVERLRSKRITVHLETSGTIFIPDWLLDNYTYVACSPKANYLPGNAERVDEIRLMVDEDFSLPSHMEKWIEKAVSRRKEVQVYLAPLSLPNNVSIIDPKSMERCLKLLSEFPPLKDARISIQMHKILGVR